MALSAEHECSGQYLPIGTFSVNSWSTSIAEDWVAVTSETCSSYNIESLRPLISAGWIQASVRTCSHDPTRSIIRVYSLPSDVNRIRVPRDDRKLEICHHKLIGSLDVSKEAWHGSLAPNPSQNGFRTQSDDKDSLFYLFNTIPSPDARSLRTTDELSQDAIDSLFDSNCLKYLKTKLYPFQRRSAAAAIKREIEPRHCNDPRLEAVSGPLSHRFFYDCQTGHIFKHARTYEEPTGGVIAENQGLGKTLIALSLILATKGHFPRTPPQYYFGLHPVRPAVASLMHMAAAAVTRNRLPWRNIFDQMSENGESHDACQSILEENPAEYCISPQPRFKGRHSSDPIPKPIRLCSATIIIVPQNLLHQWQREIMSHFHEGAFKTLILSGEDETSIPCSSELMKFDIILFTRKRFEQELCLPGGCTCQSTCHCSGYHSPLRDLHFLRVIMDEGHEFALGKNNSISTALSRIIVERTWILSGTPASGLLAVELGASGVGLSQHTNSSDLLEARRTDSTFLQEWKDLESLRKIVTGFLNIKPWANRAGEDTADWQKYVMPHKTGQRKPTSLRNILNSLFIRHTHHDIEADLALPPLHQRVVYLEPSFNDKLTQNAFALQLIVNSVSSERQDSDYMFHKKNRGALSQLLNNLRQSGFYWTGFRVQELHNTLHEAGKYRDKKLSRDPNWNSPDRVILEKAIDAGEQIVSSRVFKIFAEVHEMGIWIDRFPQKCRAAWSLVSWEGDGPLLTGMTQVAKAQTWVNSHLYENDDDLVAHLSVLGKKNMEKLWQDLNDAPHDPHCVGASDELQEKDGKGRRPAFKQPKITERFTVSKAKPTVSHFSSPGKKNGGGSDSQQPRRASDSILKSNSTTTNDSTKSHSEISRSTIRGTASSKLTYLIDRIWTLQKEEKILVFYEGDHIAYYIAQALDLLGVRYLIYTRTLDLALKSAYIATFDSKPTFRVLLMNLQQAAHGLDITSGSRVFFVNPVWQPNIEAQAIKRCHRIRQTKPVYVETLVLKGTIEEQMLHRRTKMSAQEHQHAEKSLLDDEPMSDIIKSIGLLKVTKEDLDDPGAQIASLQQPIKLFNNFGNDAGLDPDNPYADLIFPIETNKSKKLGIRKATDIELQRIAGSQTGVPSDRKRKEITLSDELEPKPTGSPLITSKYERERPAKKRVAFAVEAD